MEDHAPLDGRPSNRKAAVIGGVIGSVGLAAALIAATATAGASEPTLATPTEDMSAVVADEEFPDEEAWRAFDECVDAVFESHGFEIDDAFFDDEFDEMDEDDEFFEGTLEFGPEISIMSGDVLRFAEFGDGDGSVTVTKTGDELTVTSDGDVFVEEIDWDEAFEEFEGEFDEFDELDDAAFEALEEGLTQCEDQLPEGLDLDDEEFEDEEFEDEDLDDEEATEPAEASAS